MNTVEAIARNLAVAFLAGGWSPSELVMRGRAACGDKGRWLTLLAKRVAEAFDPKAASFSVDDLCRFLLADPGFSRAEARFHRQGRDLIRQIFAIAPAMTPSSAAQNWGVPPLVTTVALADWLGVTPAELDWFARRFRNTSVDSKLTHFHYEWRARPGKLRLLEIPKSRLKSMQRKILAELLDRIPPHPAAHGFRKRHSVISYAAPHAGRAIVMRLDLRDFFASIPASRVNAVFRTAGYPAPVARTLTGICTNAVPNTVLEKHLSKDHIGSRTHARFLRFAQPHLPQGSPTSPALANLCAFQLDCRLAALAQSAGAAYTRYADDLAFSGSEDFQKAIDRFRRLVFQIVFEKGFEIHFQKTRIMRSSNRQHLAGVVVNAHPNVARWEYDSLKAILFNCMRHGPESQNREGRSNLRAYLQGRIAYVAAVNPARAAKLRTLFQLIIWQA